MYRRITKETKIQWAKAGADWTRYEMKGTLHLNSFESVESVSSQLKNKGIMAIIWRDWVI